MIIFRNYQRALFRVAIGVLPLFGSIGILTFTGSTAALASTAIPTCSSSQLTMAADQGSGAYSAAGNQGVAFLIVNISKRACSLKGYPKFRFFPSTYKGTSTHVTDNGGGQIFVTVAPRQVVIKPGATASFGLNYGDAYNQSDPNAGPCMTQSATAWLPVWPHPYSVPFTTTVNINFCFAGFHFGVTSIQRGPVPKQR
jgi:hypothetical protein